MLSLTCSLVTQFQNVSGKEMEEIEVVAGQKNINRLRDVQRPREDVGKWAVVL